VGIGAFGHSSTELRPRAVGPWRTLEAQLVTRYRRLRAMHNDAQNLGPANSLAPASQCPAAHNDALFGHLTGCQRTPNRRSERQLITATSFPGWDGIGGLSICTSLEASNTLWKRGSGEFRGIQGR